jgi:hypothetical protein
MEKQYSYSMWVRCVLLQNLYLLVGGLARKLTAGEEEIRVQAFLAMSKISDVVGLKARRDLPKCAVMKINGVKHYELAVFQTFMISNFKC